MKAHLKEYILRDELGGITQPADRLLIRTPGTNDRDCRRNDTLVAFHVIHAIVFGVDVHLALSAGTHRPRWSRRRILIADILYLYPNFHLLHKMRVFKFQARKKSHKIMTRRQRLWIKI